jgi:hypothetical protein
VRPAIPLREERTLTAWLFASVPPLVKTISSTWLPSKLATSDRARSTAAFAGAPAQCWLDGLPK